MPDLRGKARGKGASVEVVTLPPDERRVLSNPRAVELELAATKVKALTKTVWRDIPTSGILRRASATAERPANGEGLEINASRLDLARSLNRFEPSKQDELHVLLQQTASVDAAAASGFSAARRQSAFVASQAGGPRLSDSSGALALSSENIESGELHVFNESG